MKTFERRRITWALLGAAAWLAVPGCGHAPPRAEQMADVPPGTVNTYHRKSSGSLGAFDGPVPWTVSRSTWLGQPVWAYSSPAGASLHLPGTFGLVAHLGPQGQPLMSYDPPIALPWPLEVGKAWETTHRVTLHRDGSIRSVSIRGRVEAFETVQVPAGSWQAFKVSWTDSLGEVETRWVAPADGLSPVKRHVERPTSHPQGAGVLDAALISSVRPAPR